MFFSDVLKNFYRISLPAAVVDLADVHFAASAHHFMLLKNNPTDEMKKFHLYYHRSHLISMMRLVHKYGDFSTARDESLRGLEHSENWDPDKTTQIPHPHMFDSMEPDPSCSVGEAHPYDSYLLKSDLFDFFYH